MTRSVNTRALVTLMRNGIWRERDRHLVIESGRHRSYYKQCNRAFHVCGILLWRAENLLESSSPRLRRFRDCSNGLWETLHFSTLSTNNERNQKKSCWRVNFHDHHRCASRSRNETKLKQFGIIAATSIGWGQEEGMDEDTAMWKEGVHVRSFMEAQKGKKILYFVKFFSRNKKINALTEVTENRFLTASGINSESNPFGNKPQEITAQNIPFPFPPLVSAFFFFSFSWIFLPRSTIWTPGTGYGLFGEPPPQRGTFFWRHVHEMVGILLVEVYKRVGKSVIWVCERVQRG